MTAVSQDSVMTNTQKIKILVDALQPLARLADEADKIHITVEDRNMNFWVSSHSDPLDNVVLNLAHAKTARLALKIAMTIEQKP